MAAILGEKEADFGADEPGGTGDEDFHERVKCSASRKGRKGREGKRLKAKSEKRKFKRELPQKDAKSAKKRDWESGMGEEGNGLSAARAALIFFVSLCDLCAFLRLNMSPYQAIRFRPERSLLVATCRRETRSPGHPDAYTQRRSPDILCQIR